MQSVGEKDKKLRLSKKREKKERKKKKADTLLKMFAQLKLLSYIFFAVA